MKRIGQREKICRKHNTHAEKMSRERESCPWQPATFCVAVDGSNTIETERLVRVLGNETGCRTFHPLVGRNRTLPRLKTSFFSFFLFLFFFVPNKSFKLGAKRGMHRCSRGSCSENIAEIIEGLELGNSARVCTVEKPSNHVCVPLHFH